MVTVTAPLVPAAGQRPRRPCPAAGRPPARGRGRRHGGGRPGGLPGVGLLLWITVCVEYLSGVAGACPALCTCTMKGGGEDSTVPAQRIVCSENSAITSLAQLEIDKLPTNTFLL